MSGFQDARPAVSNLGMRWHKRIRIERDGVNLAADINAVLAVNQGDSGATSRVESVRHARVVQDSRLRAESTRAEEPPEQPHADRRAHDKEEPYDQ
jgi:hypothetical protein